VDRDGKISLSDFRNMMKANKGREQLVSEMHAKVVGSVKQ
jgi:uncharacterized radical SAM superfamily protein